MRTLTLSAYAAVCTALAIPLELVLGLWLRRARRAAPQPALGRRCTCTPGAPAHWEV